MSEETVEVDHQSIGEVNAHAVHMSQSAARELQAARFSRERMVDETSALYDRLSAGR